MREEKKDYVKGPGYILIDDLEKNINECNERGGTGIYFTKVMTLAKNSLEKVA